MSQCLEAATLLSRTLVRPTAQAEALFGFAVSKSITVKFSVLMIPLGCACLWKGPGLATASVTVPARSIVVRQIFVGLLPGRSLGRNAQEPITDRVDEKCGELSNFY